MRRRTAVPLLVAAVAATAPAPAAAAVGQFATGVQPDLVTDPDGTSHVVWANHGSGAVDKVTYCRLPVGQTTCAAGSEKVLAGPRLDNNDAPPFIGRLPGGRLAVYWGSGAPPFAEVYLSDNNGSSWSTVNVGGDPEQPAAMEAGPGENLSLLFTDGATVRHRRQPVTAGGGGAGGGVAGSATQGPRDLVIGANGKPIAGFGTGSAASWNVYAGAGDGNDDGGWGDASSLGGDPFLYGPRLAASPQDSYLSYEDVSSGTLHLQRVVDGSFGADITIPFAGLHSGFGDLDADASGGVHYGYVRGGDSQDVCYVRSADGRTWDRSPIQIATRPAGTDAPLNLAVDAVGDGVGRIVYDTSLFDAPLITATLTTGSAKPNGCGVAPGATMQSVAPIGPNQARFVGILDAKLQIPAAHFIVGDQIVPAQVVGGTATAAIGTLKPSTTYPVALRVTTDSGTATSAAVNVTTPPAAIIDPPRPALKATSIFKIPAAKRCRKTRAFAVRVTAPPGVTLSQVTATIGKKRVKLNRGAKATSTIRLTRLPRGRYTLKLVATATDGRTATLTRKYRTCAPTRRR